MAHTHADTAWDGFLELEGRFTEFLRAVPPAPEHARVYSPLLASILLDCCSMIEAVLKSTMDNRRYDAIPQIARHRQRRYAQAAPFLNINDLRSVFRSDSFYAKPVWFLPRGERSFPWYAWRRRAGHPSWWSAYNAMKHGRFDNAQRASLGVTTHALKALFLTLVQSLEFRERLVERGVIRASGMSIDMLRGFATVWEVLPTAWHKPIVGMSALFGYQFLSNGHPVHARDVSLFL